MLCPYFKDESKIQEVLRLHGGHPAPMGETEPGLLAAEGACFPAAAHVAPSDSSPGKTVLPLL